MAIHEHSFSSDLNDTRKVYAIVADSNVAGNGIVYYTGKWEVIAVTTSDPARLVDYMNENYAQIKNFSKDGEKPFASMLLNADSPLVLSFIKQHGVQTLTHKLTWTKENEIALKTCYPGYSKKMAKWTMIRFPKNVHVFVADHIQIWGEYNGSPSSPTGSDIFLDKYNVNEADLTPLEKIGL